MNSILVYCELDGTRVADVSLELLSKGRELADELGVKLEAVAIGDNLASVPSQVWPARWLRTQHTRRPQPHPSPRGTRPGRRGFLSSERTASRPRAPGRPAPPP